MRERGSSCAASFLFTLARIVGLAASLLCFRRSCHADSFGGRFVFRHEAERSICTMYDEMGEVYGRNDAAMRLRAMHLLYESVREMGGTVVVPSGFSEGFGDVPGYSDEASAQSLLRDLAEGK